jgi:predicted nucleotidyltransferase
MNRLIEANIVNEILLEVQNGLGRIFVKNLLFGFVCGGFSKGYADKEHDIDIFVCLGRRETEKEYEEYLRWYFALHNKYGVKPDYDYPGEIVTHDYLVETLSILKTLVLTLEIKEVKTKKAIIWADMITSKTTGHVGTHLELLHELKREYKKYPEKWKQEVLALVSEDDRIFWKEKNHLFIMEHFMKYPKYDGKKLNDKY